MKAWEKLWKVEYSIAIKNEHQKGTKYFDSKEIAHKFAHGLFIIHLDAEIEMKVSRQFKFRDDFGISEEIFSLWRRFKES